jgi:hypothetical protein
MKMDEKRLQKSPKSEALKNRRWQENHHKIMKAMTRFTRMNGSVPSNDFLATETGLSRKTINEHFKSFLNNPGFEEEMNKFRLMAPKVLGFVLQIALMNEDLKAAKIYLQAVGGSIGIGLNSSVIRNQNNYIQINNTVLSQESVSKLTPDQLLRIEEVIKGAMP